MSRTMHALWIHVPGQDPVAVRGDVRLTLGRGSGNDIVIPDPSISRSHAAIECHGGRAVLLDLGSRNGSRVNGLRIQGPQVVAAGDEIRLGKVRVRLEAEAPVPVQIEETPLSPGSAYAVRVDRLRDLRSGAAPAPGEAHGREALAIVHELSLDLLRDESLDLMVWALLDRLFAFLRPGRGAVLLKDAKGRLCQVAARSSSHGRDFQVALSRTLVEAALERHEAMLVNDPLRDPKLGQSPSFIQSGATTLMTVPLECEAEVAGLVYLDADARRAPFNEADLQLVACLGHLAAAKIRAVRLAEEVAAKRDLEKELAIARQIQMRILPDRMPEVAGFELFGANEACRQVSGDLYGHWPGPGGKLWLALADVSGKGLGPGLLMATFQAYLQAWSETCADPAELALRLSLALSRKTAPNRFITAFLVLLDPTSGRITFTNAGHNPGLLLRPGGRSEDLGTQGFPLAMFAGRPYGRDERTMEPGELLCLYTDGLSEALDPAGREFGPEGLEAVLRAHASAGLEALGQEARAAVARHTGGAPLADDRTLLLVRRKG
ncbi:MAG TPA: SpoIIE family protein phosphatase [Holophagaceae bacterium]